MITKFTFQYGATVTKNTISNKIRKKIFTFQYGATVTHLSSAIFTTPSLFTFQYGATVTYYLLSENWKVMNLHSNMELLLQH